MFRAVWSGWLRMRKLEMIFNPPYYFEGESKKFSFLMIIIFRSLVLICLFVVNRLFSLFTFESKWEKCGAFHLFLYGATYTGKRTPTYTEELKVRCAHIWMKSELIANNMDFYYFFLFVCDEWNRWKRNDRTNEMENVWRARARVVYCFGCLYILFIEQITGQSEKYAHV